MGLILFKKIIILKLDLKRKRIKEMTRRVFFTIIMIINKKRSSHFEKKTLLYSETFQDYDYLKRNARVGQ